MDSIYMQAKVMKQYWTVTLLMIIPSAFALTN